MTMQSPFGLLHLGDVPDKTIQTSSHLTLSMGLGVSQGAN
jgi:hypothetical protein